MDRDQVRKMPVLFLRIVKVGNPFLELAPLAYL